jgi:cell division protein FtsB
MNIDERLEALVQTVGLMAAMQRDSLARFDLLSRDIQDLKTAAQQDGENIRALARIAELDHERLSRLEDRH